MHQAFEPKEIRYIKLGPGGRWERVCLERGELQFGYASVPHTLCQAHDWDAVVRLLTESHGHTLGVARDACREIRDFYMVGSNCLWITLADGRLWWSFAAPEVHWLGEGEGHGPRMRRAIDAGAIQISRAGRCEPTS